MSEESIPLRDVLKLVRRNILLIVGTVGVTTALVTSAAFVLPKRYKAKAVLNIPAAYFHNPLVDNLIAEVHDPSELTAQRLSLLRLALNDSFIDQLARRHKLYKHPEGSRLRAVERELLLKRIEYFSVNRTSFQIAVSAADPTRSYRLTQEVLDQMMNTLINERYKTLVQIRDAIKSNVEVLGAGLSSGATIVTLHQGQRSELEELEAKIVMLRSQYTDSHPQVQKLKVKAQLLRSLLKDSGPVAPAAAGRSSKQPRQDVYNDLTKKLSYLNVVLEMEDNRKDVSYLAVIERPSVPISAIFPKKRMFFLFGLAVGAVLAGVLVAYFELRRGTFLSPHHASQTLELPFLGELPALSEGSRLRLIEGPQLRRLPAA